MLWVMLLFPGYVGEQLDHQKIIFPDTGSQLAVLTLLIFFLYLLIIENTLWDSSHASVGVLTQVVIIIIRNLDVCGYHA